MCLRRGISSDPDGTRSGAEFSSSRDVYSALLPGDEQNINSRGSLTVEQYLACNRPLRDGRYPLVETYPFENRYECVVGSYFCSSAVVERRIRRVCKGYPAVYGSTLFLPGETGRMQYLTEGDGSQKPQ